MLAMQLLFRNVRLRIYPVIGELHDASQIRLFCPPQVSFYAYRGIVRNIPPTWIKLFLSMS